MIAPWLSAKPDDREKRFIQVGNSLLFSEQFHALGTGSRYSHREQTLWDAVHAAENAAILLRQYASAVLSPGQEISEYCNDTNSPIRIYPAKKELSSAARQLLFFPR